MARCVGYEEDRHVPSQPFLTSNAGRRVVAVAIVTAPQFASSRLDRWQRDFLLAVVAIIIAIASIGILGERIVSNTPAQPETTNGGTKSPPV
jgi:hypothetical protein